MEWWPTLLVAVLSPAVTAIALLWQNRINNQREDRRHAAEAAARDQERKHSIRDHWREERKEAHAALLADFQSAQRLLKRQVDDSPSDDPESGMSRDVIAQIGEHLATVQMLSLTATRGAAEAAHAALIEADGQTFAFRTLLGPTLTERDKRHRADARAALNRLWTARVAYLDAVREELGTEEGE